MTTTSRGTAVGKRRRPGFLTRADFRGAVNSALLTAGVLGAVLALYGLGLLLGRITYELGWVLYLAANGATS